MEFGRYVVVGRSNAFYRMDRKSMDLQIVFGTAVQYMYRTHVGFLSPNRDQIGTFLGPKHLRVLGKKGRSVEPMPPCFAKHFISALGHNESDVKQPTLANLGARGV